MHAASVALADLFVRGAHPNDETVGSAVGSAEGVRRARFEPLQQSREFLTAIQIFVDEHALLVYNNCFIGF